MYDYQASLESVTDGDTVRYLIDMGTVSYTHLTLPTKRIV